MHELDSVVLRVLVGLVGGESKRRFGQVTTIRQHNKSGTGRDRHEGTVRTSQ